ncbi:MAG: LacI family DNA-binding transcriptional regulator [Gleimia sp.]|jgi:LacI family transcriptional regulator
MPRATRADVARLAGVSPATVSHVLNNRAEEVGVAAATAQRVREAAEQLAYIPRATGRHLRASAPRAIGLFLSEAPTPANIPLLSRIVLPAIEEARKYSMFAIPFFPACQEDGTITGPVTAHDVLSEIDLRAAIIEVDESHIQLGHDLAQQDVPIIWMNTRGRPADLSGAISLGIDDKSGVNKALEQIVEPEGKLAVGYGSDLPPVVMSGSQALATDIDWPLEDMTREAIAIASRPTLETSETADKITFHTSIVRPT